LTNKHWSIQNFNCNKSFIIFLYNNIYKHNYCSFQLLPIGLNCSYISSIELYNVSCYLNINYSKYDHFKNINRDLYRIDIIEQRTKFDENIFALLITIFSLTIIVLLLFIGNILYIEQVRNNIPNYLKYYDTQLDSSNG